MEQAISFTGVPLHVQTMEKPEDGEYSPDILNLIDLNNIDMDQFAFGKVDAMCGRAAYEYIEKSIALAMEGRVGAVATTPINKEALKAAGVPFIGHTEIFGALTNTPDPLTMFEVRGLARILFKPARCL